MHVKYVFLLFSILQAPVSWAQRKDRLYITINVEDCINVHVQFGEKNIAFRLVCKLFLDFANNHVLHLNAVYRATSKSGEHEYVADLDLFDKINVSVSSSFNKCLCVTEVVECLVPELPLRRLLEADSHGCEETTQRSLLAEAFKYASQSKPIKHTL